jgi:hypothetical protein
MSPKIRRTAVAAAGAAVVLGGMAAPSAAAAEGHTPMSPADARGAWHCKTSSMTVDDPGYHGGGWIDDHTFTVKVCSKRIGSKVYGAARVRFDINGSYHDSPFDAARLRVYVKKSRSGPDPVRCYRTGANFRENTKPPNEDGTSSVSTGCRVSKYGRADAALKLNWDNDGRGYLTYKFRAAPRV